MFRRLSALAAAIAVLITLALAVPAHARGPVLPAPQEFVASDVTASGVTLTWAPPARHQNQVQQYAVGATVGEPLSSLDEIMPRLIGHGFVGADTRSHRVDNLEPGTQYTFYLAAMNRQGELGRIATVTITTPRPATGFEPSVYYQSGPGDFMRQPLSGGSPIRLEPALTAPTIRNGVVYGLSGQQVIRIDTAGSHVLYTSTQQWIGDLQTDAQGSVYVTEGLGPESAAVRLIRIDADGSQETVMTTPPSGSSWHVVSDGTVYLTTNLGDRRMSISVVRNGEPTQTRVLEATTATYLPGPFFVADDGSLYATVNAGGMTQLEYWVHAAPGSSQFDSLQTPRVSRGFSTLGGDGKFYTALYGYFCYGPEQNMGQCPEDYSIPEVVRYTGSSAAVLPTPQNWLTPGFPGVAMGAAPDGTLAVQADSPSLRILVYAPTGGAPVLTIDQAALQAIG